MTLYKYTGDGTGEIAGVGVVYNGLVVDVDVDLSDRDDFEVSDADEATPRSEISDVLNRYNAEDVAGALDVVEVVTENGAQVSVVAPPESVSTNAPVDLPAGDFSADSAPSSDSGPTGGVI